MVILKTLLIEMDNEVFFIAKKEYGYLNLK